MLTFRINSMKNIILLALFVSCSTSSKLTIMTKPEKASVTVYNEKTQTYEPIGETPFSISSKELKDSKMGVLRVEKPGYVTENVVIPTNTMTSTDVQLNLRENHQWISKESKSISKVAEDIAEHLNQINRNINSRSYSEALVVTNKLINKYPETSIFYDIRGSIHLLLNQKEEAKRNFTKSLELNPSNLKTKALLEKI